MFDFTDSLMFTIRRIRAPVNLVHDMKTFTVLPLKIKCMHLKILPQDNGYSSKQVMYNRCENRKYEDRVPVCLER